jgi:hypothetical protein
MKISSILAGFAFVSMVAGCSAAPGTESSDSTGSAVETEKKAPPTGIENPAFVSCGLDSDCVAVAPPPGCCNNGLKDAVNVDEVSAWDTANTCTGSVICANYMVIDTRVAECDNTTLQCAMVLPANVACDGNVENPHRCPDGWHCNYQGHSHDEPGVCEQVAPPSDSDSQ